MKRKQQVLKAAGAALALCGATWAQAELTNISSNSLHSQNAEASACTIVGTGGASSPLKGSKVLVLMAEGTAADSDVTMTVKVINQPDVVIVNDNWRDPAVVNGVAQSPSEWVDFSPYLRAPAKTTDAGLLMLALPGWAVCIFSKEKSGGNTLKPVALSITDVTAKIPGSK